MPKGSTRPSNEDRNAEERLKSSALRLAAAWSCRSEGGGSAVGRVETAPGRSTRLPLAPPSGRAAIKVSGISPKRGNPRRAKCSWTFRCETGAPLTERGEPRRRPNRSADETAMYDRWKNLGRVARRAAVHFGADGCAQKAAALSFYALFSLPGLLFVAASTAAWVVDSTQVEGRIESEFGAVLGDEGASQVRTMMERAAENASGPWGGAWGIILLLFAASGVMLQVQIALNRVWGVRPSSSGGSIFRLLMKRLVSLAMVLAVAALLVASLAVDVYVARGASAALRTLIGEAPPEWIRLISRGGNLALLFFAFLSAYRFLPDADVRWNAAVVAAFFAAAFFVAAQWAVSTYLAAVQVGSPFGAAGSLALLLIWINYSAMVFLFGAEIAQSWEVLECDRAGESAASAAS